MSGIPSNGAAILVSCIFGKIIKSHPVLAKECQACAAATMSRDSSSRILALNPSLGTQRRDQGSIDEVISYPGIFVTEQIIHRLMVFSIMEEALIRWSLTLPLVDGINHIIWYPDPEWTSY